jgi:hypothetical protein
LNLGKGTFFEVSFNTADRRVTLTPLEHQHEKQTRSTALSKRHQK